MIFVIRVIFLAWQSNNFVISFVVNIVAITSVNYSLRWKIEFNDMSFCVDVITVIIVFYNNIVVGWNAHAILMRCTQFAYWQVTNLWVFPSFSIIRVHATFTYRSTSPRSNSKHFSWFEMLRLRPFAFPNFLCYPKINAWIRITISAYSFPIIKSAYIFGHSLSSFFQCFIISTEQFT